MSVESAKQKKFACKTCGSKLRIRNSFDVTENTRRIYFECVNSSCLEEYEGVQSLGGVIRPSKMRFEQVTLDLFLIAVPENKRAAVLKAMNS